MAKEEIKELFKQVPVKTTLYEKLSKENGIKSESIRRNWFMRWEIPKDKQARTIEIMNELINNK